MIVAISDDARRHAEQVIASLTPQQQQDMLQALLADGAQAWLDDAVHIPDPVVGDAPART
jgi:hypothetical protein